MTLEKFAVKLRNIFQIDNSINHSGHEQETADSQMPEAAKGKTEISMTPNCQLEDTDEENSPILRFIQCYQNMGSLQAQVNGFVGPILALDFAQVIVGTCTVAFLSYEYSAYVELNSMLTFYSNTICVVARLIVLIVCLGNLYTMSEETNLCFGRVISRRNLPIPIHNRVMGHLAAYANAPLAYSVWGFAPVTRGTLLATFSVIATYLVLLVQS